MKRWPRGMAVATAVAGLLTHWRHNPRPWRLPLVLTGLLMRAVAPLTAVGGGLLALLSVARRDRPAALFSGLGALLAAHHVWLVATARAAYAGWPARSWPAGPQEQPARPARRRRLMPRPQVPVDRDLVVGVRPATGEPLTADRWQPPPGAPTSGLAIVYLHGSAWHYLDKDMGTRPNFRHLAGQGHQVLDLAYTLAPRARCAHMVAEVVQAVAWMKREGGVDPARVVLMGSSAGGHLALLAAYTATGSPLQPPPSDPAVAKVAAVISYYGVTDLGAFQQTLMHVPPPPARLAAWAEPVMRRWRLLPPDAGMTAVADLVPGLIGAAPPADAYALTSPLHHVSDRCPPTLLVNGAHDFGVPATQHRQLARALRQAGVPVAHLELPQTEHAFDVVLPRLSPATRAAWRVTDDFLARLR